MLRSEIYGNIKPVVPATTSNTPVIFNEKRQRPAGADVGEEFEDKSKRQKITDEDVE